MTLIHVNSPIG